MSVDIRFPNITGSTEAQQLSQMKSYLHQLVEQLNWALASVETGTLSSSTAYPYRPSSGQDDSDSTPELKFNEIKGLIIKSADIVNAYYDEIDRKLVGEYEALSDYGEFRQSTTNFITETSEYIESSYTNIQELSGVVGNLDKTLIDVTANIKTGVLYYNEDGLPVFGLEIGQRNEEDGVETFKKYARFVANKLSFYDNNDNEVAYISDFMLYITNAEIKGTFQHAGFIDIPQADKSVVTKWVGGGE